MLPIAATSDVTFNGKSDIHIQTIAVVLEGPVGETWHMGYSLHRLQSGMDEPTIHSTQCLPSGSTQPTLIQESIYIYIDINIRGFSRSPPEQGQYCVSYTNTMYV